MLIANNRIDVLISNISFIRSSRHSNYAVCNVKILKQLRQTVVLLSNLLIYHIRYLHNIVLMQDILQQINSRHRLTNK